MLATLVIGLREGLEAALIVGIIAAFLRRSGRSLAAMWIGVVLAVLLSIAVGIGLDVIEQGLPQARQEGMESVIGAIAIIFVTGMIAWMSAHAREMKRQLEAEAAQALSQAGAYALASMAFLAVLKEGFETSVFLLATFSAAQSAAWAASGAIIGLALAVVIGWGIYVGGVKINLSRFFRFTGAFLILVAAGLVISSLRAAHEAGWLNAGQAPTVNLSALVTPGTIQSALITGVLGIPADPRLIEVAGWCAYLIPVAIFIYWPVSLRPRLRTAMRLQLMTAMALACAACALFLLYAKPSLRLPSTAALVAASNGGAVTVGSAQLIPAPPGSPPQLRISLSGVDETILSLPLAQASNTRHDGVDAVAWTLNRTTVPAHHPSPLSVDQLVALSGGRMPLGLNPHEHPGPFTADWSTHELVRLWTADSRLLDAVEQGVSVVTLSGGGLQTPRTFTVNEQSDSVAVRGWRVSAAYRTAAVVALKGVARTRLEWQLWGRQVPLALLIAALLLAAWAIRTWTRLRRSGENAMRQPVSEDRFAASPTVRGMPRAAH
jgi:high-affinity iron transporter